MIAAGDMLGVLFLLIFCGLISFLLATPALLRWHLLRKRLDKAIEDRDLSSAKRLLAGLEKKHAQSLNEQRKAINEKMRKSWTKAGKEKLKSELLESEKFTMDELNGYREKVASLEASLSFKQP
jgi:hypothetical protein